jgi:hypothetical protein
MMKSFVFLAFRFVSMVAEQYDPADTDHLQHLTDPAERVK